MKVIIDIPKEFEDDIKDNFQDFFNRLQAETEYHCENEENLVCGNYELETIEMLLEAFKDMQLIPDNATNGHMIMTMFPDYRVQISTTLKTVNLYYDGNEGYTGSWIRFDLDWWNTPFKKEV